MATETFANAKRSKNDEFYTQYTDIEQEVNAYLEYNPNVFKGKTILLPCDDPEWSNFTKYFAQNFTKFELKKLISTSYAPESNPWKGNYQPTIFEASSPLFDEKKTRSNGKIFTLENDGTTNHDKVDYNDLKFDYLFGDGDFRSDEVKALRDESDIIITNPPFSLFRTFVPWVMEANKQFLIISNMNAITYKEIFPLIMENKMWMGKAFGRDFKGFIIPDSYPLSGSEARIDEEGNRIVSTNNTIWFTNLDHGRRHQPLALMTMEDNLKFSKHKAIRGKTKYGTYDNFEAIEVPFTDAIPSDYDGLMGVPISFLHKYSPEQFEIVGCSYDYGRPTFFDKSVKMSVSVNGENIYKRILIRHKK